VTFNGERYVYDLPTEAEWEFASNAGHSSWWPWTYVGWESNGDIGFVTWGGSGAATSLMSDYAWSSFNSQVNYATGSSATPEGRRHQAAGGRTLNPWSFADMYGNVWEMTADYGNTAACAYTMPYATQTDPMCYNPSGANPATPLRGGGFVEAAGLINSVSRHSTKNAKSSYGIGFRVALVPLATRTTQYQRVGIDIKTLDWYGLE
jgi:formylglycine-generating enzyme required for sulfatase activity